MVRYEPWTIFFSFSFFLINEITQVMPRPLFLFLFSHRCRIPFAKVHCYTTHPLARGGSKVGNTQLVCILLLAENQRFARLPY
ncbi:hypothetical protein LI328DRAFT_75966 [Trichoderma asperelloides]|nr:hypothetical protein LI328DRAFT_75966 [Trichoderma asperelloides]